MEKITRQSDSKQADLIAMIRDVNVCMFTTSDDRGKLSSRPMSTAHIDEESNIWFFTNEYAEKVQDVSKDNSVNLIYAHPGKNTYINIKGYCKVLIDKDSMKALWNPLMKAWFPRGLDDPKLCLLKVVTEEASYWNNSAYKMQVLAGMLKAIVKGEKYEEDNMEKIKLT
jgi:general stress protein 26